MRWRLPFVVLAISPFAWGQCDPMEAERLDPSDPTTGDDFGLAVSKSGDVILIGARRAAGDVAGAGAAYVYRLDGKAWVEEAKLTAPNGMSVDQFGQSVALGDGVAFVGAPGVAESGVVFVFEFDGEAWVLVDSLTSADAEPLDVFGASVALSGDRLVVGATREDEAASDAGAAYVFELVEGIWTEQAKLVPAGASPAAGFGSVDIGGDVIVVGAPGASDGAGAVYVYRFMDDAWALEQTIEPEELEADDTFGRVSVWDNLLVAGAPGDDDGAEDAGASYAYRFDEASWVLEAKLLASDPAANDRFGNSVDADGSVERTLRNLAEGGTVKKGPLAGSFFQFPLPESEIARLEAHLVVRDGRLEKRAD